MPDEITIREDGTAEMAYHGDVPWHRLGKSVEGAMTSAEAIAKAGLDWSVEKHPAFDGYTFKDVPEVMFYVRSDNGKLLHTASPEWKPFQNWEAAALLDDIVGDQLAAFNTAGSLSGGKRVWFQMKLPGEYKIKGFDKLQSYLLLANGHDGTLALRVKPTVIRVVCSNTLDVALSGVSSTFSARHTRNMALDAEKIREVIGLTHSNFMSFARQAEEIADHKIRRSEFLAMLGHTLEMTAADVQTALVSDKYFPGQRDVKTINQLFSTGIGNYEPAIEYTAWTAYNAVTQYLDHAEPRIGATAATQERVDSARVNRSWFGKGQEMRQRSWDYLTSLVN